MTNTSRLAGRVALIAGGGGEIGSAIARRFADEGAEVAIADLDPAKSDATARAIIAGGGRAHALDVDVSETASAKAAVARTVATFGKLTTLVNVAAAATPDGTVETLSLEQWNEAIGVNLTGAFLMCKYAVPELRRPALRRQGQGARFRGAAAPAQPPRRNRGYRRRCRLSRIRRCVFRHRDGPSDRRRLYRLQRQDRARRPTGFNLNQDCLVTLARDRRRPSRWRRPQSRVTRRSRQPP
jgi:NAD(P)-dependent dehydrogenase (short-subunit alcohol dehydrogenase family)